MLIIGLLDGGHMFIVPFFLTFLSESFYNENEVENIVQIQDEIGLNIKKTV